MISGKLFLLFLGTVRYLLPLVERLLIQLRGRRGEGGGHTTCCVDVTNKHPEGEGESADRSGTPLSESLSFRQGICSTSELSPLSKRAVGPLRKDRRNISTPDTLVFLPFLFLDVNYTSTDKSHSSPVLSGVFIFFSNSKVCVGLFV